MDGGTTRGGLSVGELARLSGVSVRALHHYEAQGLLHPERRENGYRSYGDADVRRLQRILLFRRADMPLAQIREILDDSPSAQARAMAAQLDELRARRDRLDALIRVVEDMTAEAASEDGGDASAAGTNGGDGRTTAGGPRNPGRAAENHSDRKETIMSTHANGTRRTTTDEERFAALKRQAVDENERAYGAEVRQRWGDEAADASNARLAGMSRETWDRAHELERAVLDEVAAIAAEPDAIEVARGERGRHLCELHRDWLCLYWPRGQYSPDAHRGLARMYEADPRFAAYYDAAAPGGAQVICAAIDAWCGRI